MKRFVSTFLSAIIFLGPAVSAFAWGDDGHQTVGKIASLRIKPRTAQKIAQILQPGETLASIATWADTVKERMGKTDPDPDHPLSQRNALKLLVHFLGDIHQPLHVGCGFIDIHGPNGNVMIVRDPVRIKQLNLPSDKGANDLIIDNDRKNLHSFWDFTLVTSLMTTVGQEITSDTLGTFLKQNVRPKASWNPHGPINTWAAQWATDSLHLSRDETYKSVQIVRKRIIPVLSHGQPVIRDGQPVTQMVFDITRADNYEALNRELVRQQLAKAGFRLARLLDAIYQ